MISFNRRTKVYVCKEPMDMRASYDTLFAKAKGVLNQDPFSGHLFVFMNVRRQSIKCLFYDGTGLVIWPNGWRKVYLAGLTSKTPPRHDGEDGCCTNSNTAEHAIKHLARLRSRGMSSFTKSRIDEYMQLISIYQTCEYRNVSFLRFLLSDEADWRKVAKSK